ncbi:MAG: hypothetical protein KDC55_11850 [Ignavibacteriae bacterium]|nr:hypothetical protein [Ignavibacteriota bacterium]
MNYKHFIFLSVVVLMMSIVRWNRQDLVIRQYVGADDKKLGEKLGYDVEMSLDSYTYVQYVNYYNGEEVESEVTKPYSFRFFIPLIASLLPFDSFTSLNIVCLSTEILGLLFLMKVLALIGFKPRTIFITSFLYSFSFPVFYYGVVGLLDAPAIFLIILGVYLTIRKQLILLLLTMIIATMVNEKVVLVLPFYFFFNIKEIGFKKSFMNSVIIFVAFVAVSLIVRANTINADSSFMWTVSTSSLIDNLTRIRTYISLALTGGIPLLILVLTYRRIDFKQSHVFGFVMGTIFVGLMIVYSLTAAYTDGRFAWYLYPFILPLCAYGIERK